jgi:hypothetical protein
MHRIPLSRENETLEVAEADAFAVPIRDGILPTADPFLSRESNGRPIRRDLMSAPTLNDDFVGRLSRILPLSYTQ